MSSTTPSFFPIEGLLSRLALVRVSQDGQGLVQVVVDRADKRNALSDALIAELHTVFVNLPDDARAVVLSGVGPHFCAGLDLAELRERSVSEGILHSRRWHAAFDQLQFGRVPVIAALSGAVVGGGLELAASAHLRVADRSAFFALPEGQRGIFVGGGGSVRLPRLMGVSTMTDMMLTGRVLDAEEGRAAGLCHYLVEPGQALERALALARQVATNAPLSNYAVMQALPRIASMSAGDGLFVESLMSAIAQADDVARQRVRDFLDKRGAKVARPGADAGS